jgi:hypothetical protein
MLLEKFGIVRQIASIFHNENEEKMLRPHLFTLWNKLKTWLPNQPSNSSWEDICKKY